MSPRAALRLESIGFTRVHDYVAGKADWGAASLPREGRAGHERSAVTPPDPDVPTCRLDQDLAQVLERVRGSGLDQCVVANAERIVLGRLGSKAPASDETQTVEQAMSNGPSTVRLQTALVTTSDGRLVGVVRPESNGSGV